MTTNQIELVQQSWKMVAGIQAQNTGLLLQQQLLEIVPELQSALSGKYLEKPSRKLLSLLHYIIRKLHKAEDIKYEVGKLTRYYVHCRVRDEQFIRAGRSLLAVLATGLGDKWNHDLENAWAVCYTTLAESVMTASMEYDNEAVYYC